MFHEQLWALCSKWSFLVLPQKSKVVKQPFLKIIISPFKWHHEVNVGLVCNQQVCLTLNSRYSLSLRTECYSIVNWEFWEAKQRMGLVIRSSKILETSVCGYWGKPVYMYAKCTNVHFLQFLLCACLSLFYLLFGYRRGGMGVGLVCKIGVLHKS